MSIQKIINVCETLNIDRRRVVGVQYTRSEVAKVSATPTRNPWKFRLNVAAGLEYSKNRSLIEDIDALDRQYTEVVSFSGVPGHSFIFAYQGELTPTQLADLRVQSFTGKTLVLTGLPAISAGAYVFRKGDILQITGYPHPFTVVNDVQRGVAGTISVTTHRPNFIAASVVNASIVVGNAVQFKVFCPNMPTYTLVSGGSNAIIQWTSEFELYEYTGDVV